MLALIWHQFLMCQSLWYISFSYSPPNHCSKNNLVYSDSGISISHYLNVYRFIDAWMYLDSNALRRKRGQKILCHQIIKSTWYKKSYWLNNTRKFKKNYCGLLISVFFSLKEKDPPPKASKTMVREAVLEEWKAEPDLPRLNSRVREHKGSERHR